ncbi:MAG: hypothetical protein ACRDAS_11720 [Cetobacterium sp.]
MSKVINTILSLRDNMSGPIKAASKATAEASRQLDKAKEQVKRYEGAIANANKGINNSKATIATLTKEYEKNSKEIDKTKAAIEKYSNTTGLSEKQIESYRAKLEAAKSKLTSLEAAQESNTRAVETARRVITDYERTITSNSEKLNVARSRMRQFAQSITDTNRRVAEGKKKLEEWGKAAITSMDNLIKRAGQVTIAAASITGAFAIKEGFGEAMNLEGYKTQLETATKDTEKAGRLMAGAIKFANSTPFETGEVVESTAKMEAYGISSERWLKDVADMAGATNKSIDQATEAMADGVMGEFERLKEFGIKKEALIEAAAKKYGKNIVFNKKGQIKDEKKLQDVLQAEMQKKFAGGAEKQAKTLKGLWSTVTGVAKSSLAKIVGMTDEGTIRQGSLYEKLKTQIERVVGVLNKWQEDGTIEAIAEKVTVAVEKMITFFSDLFEFIKEHRVLIETILVFVGSIYLTVKAIAALKAIMGVLAVVIGVLNGTLALSPLGWIVIGIAAVVTACYLLWQHLDAVVNMFKKLFNWVKNVLDSLGPFGFAFAALTGPVGMVIAIVLGVIQHFDKLKAAGLKLIEWVMAGVAALMDFYGWIKSLLDGIGQFAFLLGGPLTPLLALIQHFDKLKAAAEKAWGIIKKVFGADDTEVDVKVEENTKNKVVTEEIATEKPKGIGVSKIENVSTPKKVDPNFGEDKRFTQAKTESKKKTETKIEVVIQGDVYGMADFNEKVAEAVVKMVDQNKANVVG